MQIVLGSPIILLGRSRKDLCLKVALANDLEYGFRSVKMGWKKLFKA